MQHNACFYRNTHWHLEENREKFHKRNPTEHQEKKLIQTSSKMLSPSEVSGARSIVFCYCCCFCFCCCFNKKIKHDVSHPTISTTHKHCQHFNAWRIMTNKEILITKRHGKISTW